MNEIERVERIVKSTTAARGIETRSGRSGRSGVGTRTGTGIEAGTGVVVIPANGLSEMKKFEGIYLLAVSKRGR